MVTVWSASDVEAKASAAKRAKEHLEGTVYEPDKRPWSVNEGLSDYWKHDVGRVMGLGDQERYTPQARAQQEAIRAKQLGALNLLNQRALGTDSIARREADFQRQQIAKGIASQLASQRRTPAAVRGAQMAQSAALTDLAGQTQLAAAQEKLAAQQAYAQSLGGMRSQDIGMFQAEQSQEQALRNWLAAKEKMGMDYTQLGLGEKYAMAGMRQQYEQMKMAQDMALLDQAIRAQIGGGGGDSGTDWGAVLGGLGSMAVGAGLLATSGAACKTALEDGNIPLYNYLEAQAKTNPINTQDTPINFEQEITSKLGDYSELRPSSQKSWFGRKEMPNPTQYVPGVDTRGYGNYGPLDVPIKLSDEYMKGYLSNWGKSQPVISQKDEIDDEMGIKDKRLINFQKPQVGQLDQQVLGPRYWMPNPISTPSGAACKKALEDGNMELYNYLQAQAEVNKAKGIPVPDTIQDAGIGTSSYAMTGGIPTQSGAINPDFAVNIPVGGEEIAKSGVESGGDVNPVASAKGISSIMSGMGALINEVNKGDEKADLFKNISRSTPGSTSRLLGPIYPSSQNPMYRQGLQMIASDEDLKENIDRGKLYEFMDKMNPVQFDYKNPGKHGYGRRTGVIADEVQLSELGDGMVLEDPDGNLALDVSPQKFNPLVMASLAHLHKRLKNLEGGE